MTTIEVRREEDGELLGRLRAVGPHWEPLTVFHLYNWPPMTGWVLEGRAFQLNCAVPTLQEVVPRERASSPPVAV